MTGHDRDGRAEAWLDLLAPKSAPPGLHDDAMERVRRTRQRHPWIARMHAASLPIEAQSPSVRVLILVAILAALAAAAGLLVAGSTRHLPSPFGLAFNGSIAFDANGGIFERDPAGQVRTLAADPSVAYSAPAYAPDGTRVAFWATSRSPAPSTGRMVDVVTLIVRRTDGAGDVAIPAPPGAIVSTGVQPSWSADGAHLAFSATTRGHQRVVVASLDGSPPVPVSGGSIEALLPQWSPDGAWIAFLGTSSSDATDVAFYLVRPDGSDQRRLPTSPIGHYDVSVKVPRWSPVPGTLALLYAIEAGSGPGHSDIAIFDVATGKETIVSADPANEFWPSWSPDGTHVAWYAGVNGADRVMVAVVDGSFRVDRPSTLLRAAPPSPGDPEPVAGAFVGSPPAWSPDGTELYAFDMVGPTILVVPIAGGAPQVLDIGGGGDSLSWQRRP